MLAGDGSCRIGGETGYMQSSIGEEEDISDSSEIDQRRSVPNWFKKTKRGFKNRY
ncbi:hypothetical protein Bca4012_011263 [Brassica carinata]